MEPIPPRAHHSGPKDPIGRDAVPVDLQHLRRYTLGDPSLEKEVLSLFVMQLPQTVAALHAAASQRDWKIAAHTLKGSCRAVGAFRLGDLAQDAEKLGFEAASEACLSAIAGIEDAASEASSFIRRTYKL